MLIERILEAVLIVAAVGAGVRVTGVASWRSALRQRPFPVAATVLTAVLVAGALVELCWSGAWAALRDEPGTAEWWRVFTAPFIQHNGIAGTVFNIVSAAVVLALAGWSWGDLVAAAVWLVGAWAPVGAVAGFAGYHVATADVVAYSSGSSGATYFTAGTLCEALLACGTGRVRLLGLLAPAIALVMWLVTDDGHGVLLLEGAVLGLVLAGVRILLRRPATASTTS